MPIITIAGADASSSLGYSLPFDGIDYLNFFTSPVVMTRNLADPDQTAAIVGAPTITSGRLQAKSRTNFVRTNIAPMGSGTLIAAARCVDDATTNVLAPRLIGSYAGNNNTQGGINLCPHSAGNMAGLLTLNNAGAYQTLWTQFNDTITNWGLWVFRWNAGNAKIQNLTNGLSASQAVANPIVGLSTVWCIGSDNVIGGTSFFGQSEIASACIGNRYFTDDEVAELARRMRVVAARSGITV